MSRRRKPPKGAPPRLGGADLHVHSTHSDGLCSPGELVRNAAEVGLDALAITDHDTLSAFEAASNEARRVGVELIAGVELSAGDDGREVHLLGHYIDPNDPALVSATDSLRDARLERFEAMVARLGIAGLHVDSEALRRTFPRAALGRRHLADALVRSGQAATHRIVFDRYLGDGGPAQIPKPLIPIDRAIALIRGAGGVAGLPHPPYNLKLDRLASYRDAGLGALEVRGPGVDPRRSSRWRALADRFGLVPIAGSDFHAPGRSGRWVGAITTPTDDLERLRQQARGSDPPAKPPQEPPTMPGDQETRIRVVQGDITGLDVDAIVNAANESLLGGGGVDGAIHRAAGSGLLDECRALGGCPTGSARITGGYNLIARHVIHTVGPVYREGRSGEADRLRSCYVESLRLAEQQGLRTIAFPCISTGVYGYPKAEAAEIAIDAIRQWMKDHTLPEQVLLCCFGQDDAESYRAALGQS